MKIRTIITQDAEVDDRNSLRHFMLFANEVELLGIVQTSSKFHWIGVPGAVKPEKTTKDDFENTGEVSGPFDQPYRWPGTEWMFDVVNEYEQDYPNLCVHGEGYPTPDYIRSIIKVGNVGYEGEMEAPTEGSELIHRIILDEDERPLYIQVWGGTNTIARALLDIENEYKDTPAWEELHAKISKKVILTACGEQDPTYRSYIAEQWPDMMFVKTLQMRSYAYPWLMMPEGDSKDTLKADFMKKNILTGWSALTKNYCTWFDGKYYPGEGPDAQFGTNLDLLEDWPGFKHMHLPPSHPYDFLSEGDSPTFFCLFDKGFRTLEDFSNGGIAGRYEKVKDQYNSKGEALNLWDVTKEEYTDRSGEKHMVESMWRYVGDLQREFAARVDWAGKKYYEVADHYPTLTIPEGLDLICAAGESVTVHAKTENPDKKLTLTSFRVYKEASGDSVKDTELDCSLSSASFTVPDDAVSGEKLHIIVTAQSQGQFKLSRYAQIIVTVK